MGVRQPDGLCADAEDALWVGCFNTGEFLRIADGGTITDQFRFDGAAISCVLGGDDGKTLFMTTFLGPVEEVATDARKSAIFTARVAVGRPRAR
jgi:sugar lactone lactonase YvrE